MSFWLQVPFKNTFFIENSGRMLLNRNIKSITLNVSHYTSQLFPENIFLLLKLVLYFEYHAKETLRTLIPEELQITLLKSPRKPNIWSSHWNCSVKKGVPKYFPNFTVKHLRWSLTSKTVITAIYFFYRQIKFYN